MEDWLTLAELAGKTEVPARTIRFYISRGLLDGPAKAGRGAAYGRRHLARLEEIKALQGRGQTLSEIAHSLAAPVSRRSTVEPTAWWQHVVAEDVIVLTRAGAPPWRIKQIRGAIDDLAQRLQTAANDSTKE